MGAAAGRTTEICLLPLKYISCNEQYRNRPFAQPTRRPVRNRRSVRPQAEHWVIKKAHPRKKFNWERKADGFPVTYPSGQQ